MSAARRAALFDLDRTLVRKDTATLFTRYRRDVGEAGLGETLRVGLWMLQYTLGIVDAERVAERALAVYAGIEESSLEASCERWFGDYVLPHLSAAGRSAVERHRRLGDALVIVTGTTAYAARPVARELGIEDLVCTELEVDQARCFTGRLCGPVCFGRGKLAAMERHARAAGLSLDAATFYSDSITDLPLLERVAEPVVVNPDLRLRRLARQRGWRIERW